MDKHQESVMYVEFSFHFQMDCGGHMLLCVQRECKFVPLCYIAVGLKYIKLVPSNRWSLFFQPTCFAVKDKKVIISRRQGHQLGLW